MITRLLMGNRLDNGHTLFTDNIYTCVPLAKQVQTRMMYLRWTLRRNRKHLSQAVVTHQLKKGETTVRRHGDIAVSKW